MTSFGNNYVLNGHDDIGQYDPYAVPSMTMLCYSYPISMVGLFNQQIVLLCLQKHEEVAQHLSQRCQKGKNSILHGEAHEENNNQFWSQFNEWFGSKCVAIAQPG